VPIDSAEECLIVPDGTAEVRLGDKAGRVEAAEVVVVPAMVRPDVTNAGAAPLRLLGRFAGSTAASACDEPFAPEGPQCVRHRRTGADRAAARSPRRPERWGNAV
jgi:hypothetical protein